MAHPPATPTLSTPSCDHLANTFTFLVTSFSEFAIVALDATPPPTTATPTPTATPTATPTPFAVGGVVELRTDTGAQSQRPASTAPLSLPVSVALAVLVFGAGGLYVVKLRQGYRVARSDRAGATKAQEH